MDHREATDPMHPTDGDRLATSTAPSTGTTTADDAGCLDLFELLDDEPTGALFACDGVCSEYEGALSLFDDRIELGCDAPGSTASTIALGDVEAWWATVVGAAVTVTVLSRGTHTTTLPSAYRAALLVALAAQLGPERIRA